MIARDMTSRDRRFVVPHWAIGSRYRLTKADRFALVDRLIDGGARVIVLATSDIAAHAFAAGDGDVLHYVYVPKELRGRGLARRAITALLGEYSARIHVSHPWPRANHPRFRHCPDVLLRYLQEAA